MPWHQIQTFQSHKKKNMAMQCSRLTFVGGATVSASEAPVRAVPPLPPCSFVGDKTSAPRIACLWNFLVTACQTRPADYTFKNSMTVKKGWLLAKFKIKPASVPGKFRHWKKLSQRKVSEVHVGSGVFSSGPVPCNVATPPHTRLPRPAIPKPCRRRCGGGRGRRGRRQRRRRR